MARFACGKCGSQDMEHTTGIGKATGKPWQGWKCKDCKQMHNMAGIPWGDKPKTPQIPQQQFQQPTHIGVTIADVMKELKKMQDFMGMTKDIEKANEEIQLETEQAPF
jgi:hypothetical protein